MSKIEVMLDRAANNLSIISADDTDGREVETTLSLEQAWALVADLNSALVKLGAIAPTSAPKVTAKKAVTKIETRGWGKPAANPEQLREAILHAVGSQRYQNTAY